MKILLCSLAFYLSAGFFMCSVLQAQHAVTLSNYTYSAGSKVIGQIKAIDANAKAPQVKLVGPGAKLFTIDKNNTLLVGSAFGTKDKNLWHDVVIESVTAQGPVRDTFRIVKDQFIRNKVVAHRGAWKNTGATENSIGALQHAIKLGCAGSEFDVHMSADSVLFVNHDHTIQNIHIEKATSKELTQVKLSNGESLPTLDAYLREGIKQNKTRLILEIKPSQLGKERSLALTQKVVEMVQAHKAQGWVDYISFDYDILKKILALDPFAKVAYLNGDVAPDKLAQDKFYGFDYHFNVLKKNETWIDEAHQHKLTVNAWTVNDPALMDWLLAKKADFITTNEPEILLEKVGKSAVR